MSEPETTSEAGANRSPKENNEDESPGRSSKDRSPSSSKRDDEDDKDDEESRVEEPEDEEEDDEPIRRKKDRKKRRVDFDGGASFIDKEAEESENEDDEGRKKSRRDDDDDDDEEESDGQNEYEQDGFVVDDVESEEDADASKDPSQKKKRKKRRKKNYRLDDDDFALLEEASGVSITRPEESSTKFKRLKKKKREERDNILQTLQESLWGEDDDGQAEDQAVFPEQEEEDRSEDDEGEDSDDLSDFVVDQVDENGEPVKRKRNKKKRRGPARISNAQLREATSIFGDMDDYFNNNADADYYEERGRGGEKQEKRVKLEDQYEPAVLAAKYITPEDETIRRTDIPERFQLRLAKREKPDERELQLEAEWIYDRVFKDTTNSEGKEHSLQILIPQIINVLEFIRRDNFEIPFVYQYRRDYFIDLNLQDLWEIFDWDEKWAHLLSRKNALRTKYREHGVDEKYVTLLDQSQTEVEVQDLFDHFQLYYGQENQENSANNRKYKRAIKRDLYRLCKKAGITEFTKFFGLTAAQFGENTMNNYLSNMPVDQESGPDDLASQFIGEEFKDIDTVLRAARFVLAQEISYDPFVRQSIRLVYEGKAEVSTFPTEKGKSTIDAFHPYRGLLRIDRKKIRKFKESGTQWLDIVKAEKEGFITTRVEVPSEELTNEYGILREWENLYLSEGTSLVAQSWNEQRKLILKNALTGHLYPLFEKETRQKMAEEAREAVGLECAKALTKKLNSGPYKPPASAESDDMPEEVKVMACVHGTGKIPTMAVLLDQEGEVVSHLKLNFIATRPSGPDDPRIRDDMKKLTDFISEHSPHVVAVGAHMEARRLYDELHRLTRDLHSRGEISFPIHVTYVDMEISKIFQSSERASNEFPEYPFALRQAISIGRYLQDPLTEIAAMASSDSREINCQKLHPLQDIIGQEYLYKILVRCLINVVNSVGVDINRCVAHKFASSSLQFVSGMGPRKATGLVNEIYRRGGKLSSRDELESLLGPVVYTNSAGFLRILEKYFRNEEVQLLDNTRIHPDDYNLAKKMALDALETDEDQGLIENLMSNPSSLEDIDLDAFASELEKNGKPKKRSTLYSIKEEIKAPYADHRIDYRDPDENELFTMLTGENDTTVRRGMLVSARIASIKPKSIICRLDSGLTGIINIRDVSDSQDLKNLNEDLSLEEGTTIMARIKEPVQKDKLMVNLVSKGSELNSTRWEEEILEEIRRKEEYFLIENYEEEKKKTRKKKKKKPAFLPRLIEHPLFQNVSYEDSEKLLADKENGEFLIRPSSKGYNYLTITWKFYDSLFVHITIKEEGKTSALRSIGKTLIIGTEKFEDLNEVIANYMEPMISYATEMFSFRVFKDLPNHEIDNLLGVEKRANAGRIPYFISVNREQPGKFLLSYQPGSRPKRESVYVTPQGYRFRTQIFTKAEKLISWFKVHFKDAIPRPAPARENIPAMMDPYSAQMQQGGGQHMGQMPGQGVYPPMYQAAPQQAYGQPPMQAWGMPPGPGAYPPPQQLLPPQQPPRHYDNRGSNYDNNSSGNYRGGRGPRNFNNGPRDRPSGPRDSREPYNRSGGGGGYNSGQRSGPQDPADSWTAGGWDQPNAPGSGQNNNNSNWDSMSWEQQQQQQPGNRQQQQQQYSDGW